MHYKSFGFRNFKGIEQMTLDLDADVTTLIGLNESGKTTILEAIYCFSYGAEDLEAINPEMASLRVPEQWIPISRRANFNDTISIRAVVSLSGEDKKALRKHMKKQFGLKLSEVPSEVRVTENYEFENSRHANTGRLWMLDVKGTTGKQRNPRIYDGETDEWRSAMTFLKSRLPRIWYFPNFLFELPDRFELGDLGGLEDEERDKSRFYHSTFEEILSQLGYGATLATHVVERLHSDERADQTSLKSVLLDMSRVITSTVFEGWDRIFGQRPTAQEVELTAEPDDSGGAFLELQIKGPDGYYDLSERSLGFRWFFMFLLMTSFHRKSENESRSLFLLDEPASNLHSSAQAELLKSFENLIDDCYLIYTTHSHHLINVKWLDSAYVVKNAALGSLDNFKDYVTQRMGANTSISATRYRRFVAEHPDQTSYFQPVLDLLEYRPSTVEPVPDVVLVEGKSDFYLLRYAIDTIGLRPPLNLVPGTGSGALDPMIRLHLGWGKSFIILLDGDAAGKKQMDRYQKMFGPTLNDRCLLLPDITAESVVEAEDLLSKGDQDAIIAAVFPDSKSAPQRKKALSQGIMELYARQAEVALEAETIKRLEALMKRLSRQLASQQ